MSLAPYTHPVTLPSTERRFSFHASQDNVLLEQVTMLYSLILGLFWVFLRQVLQYDGFPVLKP